RRFWQGDAAALRTLHDVVDTVTRLMAPLVPFTTSIEDDIPEEDDPDLDESALSGHDLIMRELGATVVEEYTNE
ncbi:hypothetical protein ACFTWE_12390, partial [Streptomyces albidoflavus]